MDERKKRGDRGEEAVAAALERRGWTNLARQYRCRWGEIGHRPAPGGCAGLQEKDAAGRRVLVFGTDRPGLPLPVRCGGGLSGGRRGTAADQLYHQRV